MLKKYFLPHHQNVGSFYRRMLVASVNWLAGCVVYGCCSVYVLFTWETMGNNDKAGKFKKRSFYIGILLRIIRK